MGHSPTDTDGPEKFGNVYRLDAKAVEQLSAYMQHVGVYTMFYEMNACTQYFYPLKPHEYLAAGKPVVSKPIRALRGFAALMGFASTDDEWCDAIERNLSVEENAPVQREARLTVVRRYDWNKPAGDIAAIIIGRLAG